MNFDSYIISETKTSLSMPLACPPPRKLKHSKGFKRFAFTLAETLITLTIIGVVAALTIPTLMNKYTKHTSVVGLKKAYAQLQHAMKMIPITEGCSAGDYDCAGMFQGEQQYINGQYVNIPVTNIDGMDFGGNNASKQMYLISKQFKIQDICFRNESCKIKGYTGAPKFKTQDGSIFEGGYSTIGVDINGDKGPNKMGRDIYTLMIANERRNGIEQGTVIPFGSKIFSIWAGNDSFYWKNNNSCSTENVNKWGNTFCAGRVLEENAMNY